MNKLLNPYSDKHLSLQNRVVMAPMTRSRATADHVPTDIMATYYGGRATAGLLITEGVAPSPNGVGYARIPGIYNQEQVAAWKPVTDAVHANGGKIFVQLMHTGRVSHTSNMPTGAEVVAPSPIPASNTQMYVDGQGNLDLPVPKEMTQEDIQQAIQEFVTAAKNAVEAGFDGVEIHGANGYLVDQFINPHANQRTDEYGGSAANRSRFAIEVAKEVVAAIGAANTGIRFSPNGAFNDATPFEDQQETYTYLAEQLNSLDLAYIHLVDHSSMGAPALPVGIRDTFRAKFEGALILSGGYDGERAEKDLQDNLGDLVAFGRLFIPNPDLVARFSSGAPLNEPKPDLFYTPGPEGYIDYPTLSESLSE